MDERNRGAELRQRRFLPRVPPEAWSWVFAWVCACAWEPIGPPGCVSLAMGTVPATRAARGLGCACGCILHLPPASECRGLRMRGAALG